MLDFQQTKIGKLLDEKGSAMVEYAILLAFIAVVAVAFATEFLMDEEAWQNNQAKPGNLASAVRWIIYDIRNLFVVITNMLP
ncbi:MAG: hypothetical protein Q4P09_02045 [Phascolarctobacterium sp.]|nr:hypothetical protein [Phascolarctobacterium sp.]